MAYPNFPMSVVRNPLTISLYSEGFQNELPPENESILTELGAPLETQAGTNLLIE